MRLCGHRLVLLFSELLLTKTTCCLSKVRPISYSRCSRNYFDETQLATEDVIQREVKYPDASNCVIN